MSNFNNGEPSLDKIDDYNGTESKQKRNIVRLVVLFCLLVGGFMTYAKLTSTSSDYIGTVEQPGINTVKNK